MTQTTTLRNSSRRCFGSTLAWSVMLLDVVMMSAMAASDDPRFRQSYTRSYDALKGVAPDMLVMELRDRVELIAGRGSQVGAATNAPRVRGFESALLQGLQTTICGSASAEAAARPSPIVMEKIGAAASTQQMRMQSDDIAELTALAQRLIESQRRDRWCSLRSLDDIR